MLPRHNDPIAAIATAPGRGAVGIVRVSGFGLAPLVQALFDRPLTARLATYLPFRDEAGAALDHGLAVWFPAPHSYTGEDVLELQAHGGPVVLQLLLARVSAVGRMLWPTFRIARPGEFTERAFLNDKLDLAQAEAVADLIDASTEAAARSAARSLSGVFSGDVQTLRERIVRLRMLVEATLDFPEEDIDFLRKADARGQLDAIVNHLDTLSANARRGSLLREGMQVVLAGQPNVGKSSLLNALAGAELAIVTPIPGTTRDKVSQTIQIDGVPVHVIDTAGLRDQTQDEVERIGIDRSWDAIAGADTVVLLHDLTRIGDAACDQADQQIERELHARVNGDRVLHVFNKADMSDLRPQQGIAISALNGNGLSMLRRILLDRAGWTHGGEGVFIARERHLNALARTREHLDLAHVHAAQHDRALDLFAEELRLAHEALGAITGAFSADDLLGEIFSRFCIGK